MLGPLIGAASSLIGGFMNSSAVSDANGQNAALARENMDRQDANAIRNIELQKEFAQSGLQWKAADALKAGIHPIYAMGASGASFSPVTIAGSSGSVTPNTAVGDAIARSGQDLSRAATAAQSTPAKVSAIVETQQQLQTQNMGLQNELLAAQIAKAKQTLVQPSMPTLGQRYAIEGQAGAGSTTTLGDNKLEFKQEIVPSAPGAPSQELATIPDVGYSRTPSGGYAPLPSKDVKERIEDNILQEVMHAVRNNLYPSLGFNYNPPKTDGGPHGWGFNPFKQEYYKRKPVPGSFGYLYY